MLPAGTRRAPRGAALAALLLAVTAAAASVATADVADDFFSPFAPMLAPVINSICSTAACGKGNCTAAPSAVGYRCECDPGWKQLHVGDALRFLPCVIPNCSINSACSNDSSAPAPAPLPASKNFSLDPCALAYCGSGGTCRNASGLSYHCDCKEGYNNLLNITTMPCFQECSIGADCANLGITPPGSPPAPPGSESLSNNGNAAAAPGSSHSRQFLLPLLVLVSLMAVDQAM